MSAPSSSVPPLSLPARLSLSAPSLSLQYLSSCFGDEQSLRKLLGLASSVVALQSTLSCWGTRAEPKIRIGNREEGGCVDLDAWAVTCSSIGLAAVVLLLLLVQVTPHLQPSGCFSLLYALLLGWWSSGVLTLTFDAPNCLAGNAYFGTWMAFLCSWKIATLRFPLCASAHIFWLTPRAGVLLASFILTDQSLVIFEKGSDHACTAYSIRPGMPSHLDGDPKREFELAILFGIVGACLGLGNYSHRVCPSAAKPFAVVSAVWWSLAVSITTCYNPYVYIGNGYLACWAGWLCSSAVVFEVFPSLLQSMKAFVWSLGVPLELLALVLLSLVVSLLSIIAYGERLEQGIEEATFPHELMAVVLSSSSSMLSIFVIVGRKRWAVTDRFMAQFAVCVLVLWAVTTFSAVFVRPFRLLGNGFAAVWSSFVVSALLVRTHRATLGCAAPMDRLEALLRREWKLAVPLVAACVLTLQAVVDSGHDEASVRYLDESGPGILCGVGSLIIVAATAICKTFQGLHVMLRWFAMLLTGWWCTWTCKLTFDIPYIFLDNAYVSCWAASVASGLLLQSEWQAFLASQVQQLQASQPTSVIPTATKPAVGPVAVVAQPVAVAVIAASQKSKPAVVQPTLQRNTSVEKKGWHLEHLRSSSELEALTKLLHVPDPENLGKGRDVTTKDKYTSLKLVDAWRIEKPSSGQMYQLTKESIETEVRYLTAENGLKLPGVTTKLDDVARKLVDISDSVNEKLLLHGTKPEHALSIIHNGLSEKLSGGLFGKGVYLAEDPSKIDQYCTPDVKMGEGGDMVKSLQERLYKDGAVHQGNIHYCFVVRAVLGIPISTKDGIKNMAEPFQDIYATDDKRELATIPNSNPPMHYHSLIAEVGKDAKLKRHREFITFEGSRLKLEYILAFKRC